MLCWNSVGSVSIWKSVGSVSGYRWIALWITSIHQKNRNRLSHQPLRRNRFLTSSLHQPVPWNRLSCQPVCLIGYYILWKFQQFLPERLQLVFFLNDKFASLFCTLLVTRDWIGVSLAMLFMLRSIYSTSSFMTHPTDSLSFLLDNLWLWRSWYSLRVSITSGK